MTRRSKYGATKVTVDGVTFDSKREARRYADLKLLERAGDIRNLELQPKFPIVIKGEEVRIKSRGYSKKGRAVKYIADFAYFRGHERIVEDSKGFDTPVSRLKRALVEHIYNVKIELV